MPRDYFNYLPIAIVILIVLRRASRPQKVRVDRIWVIPVLSLIAVGSALAREPFPGLVALAAFAFAVTAGAGAGYLRALHQELAIDPATGEVSSKATAVGTILIVAFLILRFAMDYALNGRVGPHPPRFLQPAQHGFDLFRLADAALMFTTAMMLAQRVEILRRTHVLLRASPASPGPSGPPSGRPA